MRRARARPVEFTFRLALVLSHHASQSGVEPSHLTRDVRACACARAASVCAWAVVRARGRSHGRACARACVRPPWGVAPPAAPEAFGKRPASSHPPRRRRSDVQRTALSPAATSSTPQCLAGCPPCVEGKRTPSVYLHRSLEYSALERSAHSATYAKAVARGLAGRAVIEEAPNSVTYPIVQELPLKRPNGVWS